jgi:hypothetical protein
VLASFPDEHAALANRGFPVVGLWLGIQLTAVVLAEATGRLVFWWLEPHRGRRIGRELELDDEPEPAAEALDSSPGQA